MATLRHGHETEQGVSCNDRKFEVWDLKGLQSKDGKLYERTVRAQVYAVPRSGFRGAQTDGFKIVINGVAVTSRDLGDLRTKATALIRDLSEDEHEKVLVVRTSGNPERSENTGRSSDSFGISWQVGWRISKLDVVFDEDRSYVLNVENYDEDYEPEHVGDGIVIGSKPGHRGKQTNKTAVIPWTKEREDILRRAVKAIGEMRDRLNGQLLKPEAFAGSLDAKAGALLLGPKESA